MNEPTLQLLNDHLLVEFEERPKLSEALDLVMPERYLIQEADQNGEQDAYGVVTDRRTINPQIVNVIQGNAAIPRGSRCFVHYGAFEIAKWYQPKQAVIRANMVFFLLDPIRPLEGNYLAEEIFVEAEKTASGIYLTPHAEHKLPCNVKILHVPDNAKLNVGDEVITVDAANYTLKYNDKTYVRLKENEMVAKMVDGQVIPLGKNILIEYLEEDLSEIIAENERRAEAKAIALKYRLFTEGADYTPLPPPKQAPARIVRIGQGLAQREFDAARGDEVSVVRGKGVMLNDNQWIINLETILFLYAKR